MEPLFFNIVDEHLFCRGDHNFRCKKNKHRRRNKRKAEEGREKGEIGIGEREMRENGKLENKRAF